MRDTNEYQPSLTANRSTTPTSARFTREITGGWKEQRPPLGSPRECASFTAERRALVSARYRGTRLLIAAGVRKRRSNDMDYPFRASSDFAWLTGWGSDTEPGAVLLFDPVAGGHEVTLFFRAPAGRTQAEFYSDPEIGEFWIGPRPSLEHVAVELGVPTRDLVELDVFLRTETGGVGPGDIATAVIADADPRLSDLVGERSVAAGGALARDLSEMRLIKDAYEIEQLRAAVEATGRGFDDVLAALPKVINHARGERIIDGVFHSRARVEGNTTGYNSIVAAGAHSCVLHWMKNSGGVNDGDLVLLDAGVEMDSLYTADITRTFPVNGRYSDVQRRVHHAVVAASDAAFAVARPGVRFRDVHDAAMAVIARVLADWGMLEVSPEVALAEDGQQHRRYLVHGISHHLGLDVHDCALARRELYLDGVLEAGMVFTIEPGLYFQADDLTVPEELRGIGIRVEDDIVVTVEGAERLSAGIPRTTDAIEGWIASVAGRSLG